MVRGMGVILSNFVGITGKTGRIFNTSFFYRLLPVSLEGSYSEEKLLIAFPVIKPHLKNKS